MGQSTQPSFRRQDDRRARASALAAMLALLASTGYGSAVETVARPGTVAASMTDAMADRELSFIHQIHRPQEPNGRTIVLLHGSGADESSLVPLASRIAPHATLLAVRGRVVQEGLQRWYRRITPVEFDQDDIRAEANAFARFLSEAAKAYELDLSRTTFLGYSNGANLIAAMSLMHPHLVRRAVLLRPMCVLDEAPRADLAHTSFLTVVGKADELYASRAPELEDVLRGRGARVDARVIPSGHELGDDDIAVVREWLAAANGATAALR